MTTSTSGHLANNGGVRGHSAGDIFPWRVMGQGIPGAISWHVINPAGEKVLYPYRTPGEAMHFARIAHATWSA